MACVATYQNCLESHCCASTSDGCFRRPTLQYAQCRPAIAGCTDTDDWLCPGWWILAPPSPPPPPSPPRPPIHPLGVSWSSDDSEPFSLPFSLSARDGLIWLEPVGCSGCSASPLHIKGANWFGFQSDGCVHELWKHSVQDYIDFLVTHDFNAVRLPLSAPLIAADGAPGSNCGECAYARLDPAKERAEWAAFPCVPTPPCAHLALPNVAP